MLRLTLSTSSAAANVDRAACVASSPPRRGRHENVGSQGFKRWLELLQPEPRGQHGRWTAPGCARGVAFRCRAGGDRDQHFLKALDGRKDLRHLWFDGTIGAHVRSALRSTKRRAKSSCSLLAASNFPAVR